jgi:hypothetical protein
MAIRIQFRRDLAVNWTLNNPILLNGEIGIETDTLKFKIGNGLHWNDITSYAFKPGEANGIAVLNAEGKLAVTQLPDEYSVTADFEAALAAASTTNIQEGTNLYFTNARAEAAVTDNIDNAFSLADANSTTKANAAKSEAISAAASDATTKANTAKAEAISESATDATAKAAAAKAEAILEAATDATEKDLVVSTAMHAEIESAVANEVIARNAAISSEASARTTAINAAINSLSTTDIEEGSNLYFTESRARTAVASDIAVAVANFDSGINSTTDVPEGTNLYFKNERAVAATNSARTQVLQAALSAVDDLRTELTGNLNNSLSDYVLEADRNQTNGFAGLDSNGVLSSSVIPSTIATKQYADDAVAALVASAPGTLNTLSELAAALADNQDGLSAINTAIGLKLDSSLAGNTYETIENVALKAPIHDPVFTGVVTIPTGAEIVGYLKEADAVTTYLSNTDANSNYLTKSEADITYLKEATLAEIFLSVDNAIATYLSLNDAQDTYATKINPALSGNIALPDLGSGILQASNGLMQILSSVPNSYLENSSITINGTQISLGQSVSLSSGYANSNSSITGNTISYGSSATPPSGVAIGDIYIQY